MRAASPTGIGVSLDELRQIRGEALRLGIQPGDSLRSLFPGAYRAVFHGRGIEFDEVRNYQWGDDYRTIDWRVTARTGQMHTKLFQEEREHALYLLVDTGPSMQFGTRVRLKWVQAARVAALFAWLALANGDRVGAILFGHGSEPRFLNPAAGEPGVLRILQQLADLRPAVSAHPDTLPEALLHLRQRAGPGSLILLLSDFFQLDQGMNRHLSHLGRFSDLAAVRIFDPLEKALPPPGRYPITDGEQLALLDTRSAALHRRFRRHFESREEKLRTLCNRHRISLISLGADQPLVEGMRETLIPLLPRAADRMRRRY